MITNYTVALILYDSQSLFANTIEMNECHKLNLICSKLACDYSYKTVKTLKIDQSKMNAAPESLGSLDDALLTIRQRLCRQHLCMKLPHKIDFRQTSEAV